MFTFYKKILMPPFYDFSKIPTQPPINKGRVGYTMLTVKYNMYIRYICSKIY